MARIVNLENFPQFTAINVLSDGGLIPGKHPIPNCIEIKLVWIQEDGKNANNVLHGSRTDGGAVTQSQANAIIAGLTTGGAWTAMAAFLSTTTTLAGVFLRDLRVIDQPYIQNTTNGAPGTSVSAPLPNEVALAVTLRTAKVGAGNRGRFYLPGFATNALGAGNVASAATVTAVNNWSATIPTTLTGQGYTFCLRQPPRAEYTGSSGTHHDARVAGTLPIIQQTVRDNHWDSQRRRGLK